MKQIIIEYVSPLMQSRILCLLFSITSVSSFAFNDTFEVKVGDTFSVYTTPQNSTYSILWEFDHSIIEPVAQIYTTSTSVKFRAVAPSVGSGSIIQATSYYPSGRHVDSWRVIVEGGEEQNVKVERITLNAASHTFALHKKDSFILEATTYPSNATNDKLIWSSTNEDVVIPETNDVFPNQIGFWVKKCGTATITCTAADGGGAMATCFITVVDGEKHWIKAQTEEGVEVKYIVEDATNGTCEVAEYGVDRNVRGIITIPETVEGEHLGEPELGVEKLQVVGISDFAFAECSGLTGIILPESVNAIGRNAFGWTGLTSITIPNNVTEIGDGVCYHCENLNSATLPDHITVIGAMFFDGCSSLVGVTIPDDVTSIGVGAFSGCTSLTSVNIPEGVVDIGYNAFLGCRNLTSIVIPSSVLSIGSHAFDECI